MGEGEENENENWGFNKHQKWKKHIENIKMAKFEVPVSKEWDFCNSLQADVLIYSFLPGASNLGIHNWYFRHALSISGIP